MTKSQKVIRSVALKSLQGVKLEGPEPGLWAGSAANPATLTGALKPLPPSDSTLLRLIERIKNL